LAIAVAIGGRHASAADDGWHDIPCGSSPLAQPESYDGPILCRRGPESGADTGLGSRLSCSYRQYQLLWGRALKGADPSAPAAFMGVNLSEANTSRCQTKLRGSEASVLAEIRRLGSAWVGGHDWMAGRAISDGYAIQFVSRDRHRCIGFETANRLLTAVFYGVYCDYAEDVPVSRPYTDDEIKIRVGVARLSD
jgi:hypothetical protein